MKLLMIEDNINSVKRIYDFANDEHWECLCCGFDTAESNIKVFEPDIIVLDWMYDVENAYEGEHLLELVWSRSFCPVVIFSCHCRYIRIKRKIYQ